MITMTIRMPLAFGLVADVVSDESDRLPYVPPPLPQYEAHHETCGCAARVKARPRPPAGRSVPV